MATILKFEDIESWQLARELNAEVFKLMQTEALSKDYALKNQINRSAGSIMDNIAEGFGRSSRLEFIQFLSISAGSADELKSQIYRCLDREYINEQTFQEFYERINIVSKKVNAFINYLNKSSLSGTKFKNRTKTTNN